MALSPINDIAVSNEYLDEIREYREFLRRYHFVKDWSRNIVQPPSPFCISSFVFHC